jgi:hypothetical protein
VYDVDISALWWDTKIPKENKQNATLYQVKCKVVLALSKFLKIYACWPGSTYPRSLPLSSRRMRCQLHATIGFTYKAPLPTLVRLVKAPDPVMTVRTIISAPGGK